jgi:hypothetical protein
LLLFCTPRGPRFFLYGLPLILSYNYGIPLALFLSTFQFSDFNQDKKTKTLNCFLESDDPISKGFFVTIWLDYTVDDLRGLIVDYLASISGEAPIEDLELFKCHRFQSSSKGSPSKQATKLLGYQTIGQLIGPDTDTADVMIREASFYLLCSAVIHKA